MSREFLPSLVSNVLPAVQLTACVLCFTWSVYCQTTNHARANPACMHSSTESVIAAPGNPQLCGLTNVITKTISAGLSPKSYQLTSCAAL